MSSIDDLCRSVLDDIEGGLGVAVIDLHSGLLLGAAHSVPYFTQTNLDALAAAAVEMFRGRLTSSIEELISSERGTPNRHMIDEIQMSTPGTYHFMLVLPNKPDALISLITTKRANLGAGWSSLRRATAVLEPMLP
ncbi:MAG: hypothetical protein J7480_05185 [Microbacteriaceae bacterium]|nr:hypothetical protein [Microbacteriaceae bacterium]